MALDAAAELAGEATAEAGAEAAALDAGALEVAGALLAGGLDAGAAAGEDAPEVAADGAAELPPPQACSRPPRAKAPAVKLDRRKNCRRDRAISPTDRWASDNMNYLASFQVVHSRPASGWHSPASRAFAAVLFSHSSLAGA